MRFPSIVLAALLLPSVCAAAILPVTYQLFGPAHAADGVTGLNGPYWKPVGSCFTCSTQKIGFQHEVLSPHSARLLVCWIPRNVNTMLRVISFDDGPTNIVEIGRLRSNGSMNPTCDAIDLTSQILQLKLNMVQKQIGFQIMDDGHNSWTLYEVQLDINYELNK